MSCIALSHKHANAPSDMHTYVSTQNIPFLNCAFAIKFPYNLAWFYIRTSKGQLILFWRKESTQECTWETVVSFHHLHN